MTMRARRPYKNLWRRGVLAMGLVAIGLGLWQFRPDFEELADPVLWFNAGLKTLQLFVLQIAPTDLPSWYGRVAAVLAPLAAAGAVLAAFSERLSRRWRLTQLWWAPATDVFLGGGDTAAGVATRRCRAIGGKVKIIGLDPHDEPPLAYVIAESNLLGFVRAGDALSHDDLGELKLHRARNVWVSTGDELRNLEIARRVCALLGNPRVRPKMAVRLFVQVFDQCLVRSRESLFPGLDPMVVVLELYAMPRLAARTVLRLYPPRLVAGQTAPHLLIMGSSKLAAALALHAVQHCVYSEMPAESLRITLVGAESRALQQQLRRQSAALNPSADLALHPLLPLVHIAALETDETEFSALDWQQAQQDGRQPFSAVYATCVHDAGTLHAALRAVALREITHEPAAEPLPIVACFQQAPCTEGTLADAASASPWLTPALQKIKGLAAFGVFEQCISPDEDYPGERQDQRALLVHAAYNRVLVPDGASQQVDDAMRQRWIAKARDLWRQELEKGAYRWSSRLCADHIELKLAILACQPARLAKVALFDVNEPGQLASAVQARFADYDTVMAMARLEHRRFVVERLLEGWLPLPSQRKGHEHSPGGLSAQEQKDHLLLNHTLVPFDRLAEVDPDVDQRQKDIDIVRAIPEILRCERLMDNQPSGAP